MDSSTTSLDRASDRRPPDTIIPFSRTAPRRFRRGDIDADGPRGQILLFTGVRYERLPDPVTAPAAPKRKRS